MRSIAKYRNEGFARRQFAMITSALEYLGKGTLRHVEYVGSLAMQLRAAVGSLRRTLPLTGTRNLWGSAVRQMLAVGVDAFPMGGVMALCAGFFLAMEGGLGVPRFCGPHLVINLVWIG